MSGFRFALVLEDGEPADPGVFATIIPHVSPRNPPWRIRPQRAHETIEPALSVRTNLGYRIEFPVSRAVHARGQAESDGASTRERRRFRRRRN